LIILARRFFCPEDGDHKFLQTVGSHKTYTAPYQKTAFFIDTAMKTGNLKKVNGVDETGGFVLSEFGILSAHSTNANQAYREWNRLACLVEPEMLENFLSLFFGLLSTHGADKIRA
jgi:hypothetical protein